MLSTVGLVADRFNPYYCLKKMQFIFNVKPLATNISRSFIQNTRNNVMPISGTHIVMKRAELADCFSIIAKQQMT
jgi:hypothetical protein